MKKKLILDKELITTDSTPTALDGGTATIWPICYSIWSCGPDNCPSCGSCPGDEE